ncbi:MAG: hypothetical protein ABEN55_05830, partial [Bradymonadaceae bacterium]
SNRQLPTARAADESVAREARADAESADTAASNGTEAAGTTDPDTADKPEPYTVEVDTYPSRAAIFHKGNRLGLPPHEVELPADVGTTALRVIRKGYYPKTFEVTPSQKTNYRISLERRPRRQARGSDDGDENAGAGSKDESSGRPSNSSNNDEIENILDEHKLD